MFHVSLTEGLNAGRHNGTNAPQQQSTCVTNRKINAALSDHMGSISPNLFLLFNRAVGKHTHTHTNYTVGYEQEQAGKPHILHHVTN